MLKNDSMSINYNQFMTSVKSLTTSQTKQLFNGMANPDKMEYPIPKWNTQFINGFFAF